MIPFIDVSPLVNENDCRSAKITRFEGRIQHNFQGVCPESAGNIKFAAGAFVVSGIPADRMQSLAAEFGLKFQAVQKVSEPVTQIKAPRIGIYGSWQGNMDEGWTGWLLEQFEFPFTLLRNADIQAGHLKELFDVVLFAEQGTDGIMEGNWIGTTHEQEISESLKATLP
jgi:hypothetical protein